MKYVRQSDDKSGHKDKNNFEAYILYGINKKVTFGECIKYGM